MATIDSNIALGVKPLQIENPMNQYAAMSQIQNAQNQNIAAQNQNALAQYQLSAAKRGDEKVNFLNRAFAENTDPTTGKTNYQGVFNAAAKGGFGSEIPNLIKQKQAEDAAAVKVKSDTSDLIGKKLLNATKLYGDIDPKNPNAVAQYMSIHDSIHNDDDLGPYLKSLGVDRATAKKSIADSLKTPGGFERLLMQSQMGAKDTYAHYETVRNHLESEKVAKGNLAVNQGQLVLAQNNAVKPVFSEAAGGFVTLPTAQNPTSAIIPLANPQDTTKGKVVTQGKGLVNDVATEMANAYGVLKDLKGIKSKDNTRGQNISAALGSSSVGQMVGSLTGSQEQDARDVIMSQRPILVQGIVKATGMSASQINSNQELKTLLDAATDPSKGYETNINTLNKINKRFGLGGDIVDLSTTPNKTKSGSTTSNW